LHQGFRGADAALAGGIADLKKQLKDPKLTAADRDALKKSITALEGSQRAMHKASTTLGASERKAVVEARTADARDKGFGTTSDAAKRELGKEAQETVKRAASGITTAVRSSEVSSKSSAEKGTTATVEEAMGTGTPIAR